MFERLKARLRGNSENLAGLILTQASNAIFPLVIFPLAYTNLGSESFASIIVAESFILIAVCVTLYSHDIDGIKWIASNPDHDSTQLSEAYSEIFWTRVSLASASAISIGIFLLLYDRSLLPPFFAWTPLLIGHILQSTWLFQAKEDNLAPGIISAFIKTVCAFILATLILNGCNPIIIPAAISFSYLASGATIALLARTRYNIKLAPLQTSKIIRSLRFGRHIFLGNFSILLFRGSNTLILNHFSNDNVVAAYALAEKVIKTVQATLRPINQILHAKLIAVLTKNPKQNALIEALRYTKPQTILVALIVSIVAVSYSILFHTIPINTEQRKLIETTLAMSPAILFGVANYMLGNAALNATQRDREYSFAVLLSGLLSLAFSTALIWQFALSGAIVAYIFGEAILFAFIIHIHTTRKAV